MGSGSRLILHLPGGLGVGAEGEACVLFILTSLLNHVAYKKYLAGQKRYLHLCLIVREMIEMQRFLQFCKKLSGFALTILPSVLALLQFFLKINDISDLAQYAILEKIVSFLTPHMWTIIITLSAVFIVSYILSHFLAYHLPVTTGGHLKEFEAEKLKSFYTIRCTREEERYMDNRGSSYYITIRACAENMCDKIADLMAFNFNKEFSVCIKLIDIPSSRITRSANQVNLITFCRGGKDKDSRSECDAKKVPLRENSDFLNIFNGAPHFSTGNLQAYALLQRLPFGERSSYSNTSQNYTKKYLSTIVVPIRLQNRYVTNYYSAEDPHGNQLLGFLCIDCKHRCSPFTIKKMLPYMQAFADNLYLFFDEILQIETERRSSGAGQSPKANIGAYNK